jgi:hypothetical protein
VKLFVFLPISIATSQLRYILSFGKFPIMQNHYQGCRGSKLAAVAARVHVYSPLNLTDDGDGGGGGNQIS